jgi:hypothetical protein
MKMQLFCKFSQNRFKVIMLLNNCYGNVATTTTKPFSLNQVRDRLKLKPTVAEQRQKTKMKKKGKKEVQYKSQTKQTKGKVC